MSGPQAQEIGLLVAPETSTSQRNGKRPLKVTKEMDLDRLIEGVLLSNNPFRSHDANGAEGRQHGWFLGRFKLQYVIRVLFPLLILLLANLRLQRTLNIVHYGSPITRTTSVTSSSKSLRISVNGRIFDFAKVTGSSH
jgi:hypothetical protein